jgi:hypothetical protein
MDDLSAAPTHREAMLSPMVGWYDVRHAGIGHGWYVYRTQDVDGWLKRDCAAGPFTSKDQAEAWIRRFA